MKDIEAIAAEIVAREGGYVNDPDDPGGPTKYGVTLATLRWKIHIGAKSKSVCIRRGNNHSETIFSRAH